MKRKTFTWISNDGTITLYPSLRKAARALGYSLTTIRYYAEKGIHSAQDRQWEREKQGTIDESDKKVGE